MTNECESSTLGLLFPTKFEAADGFNDAAERGRKTTHCLQRFNDSCILYLHTVHSNRNTTFFVVFA